MKPYAFSTVLTPSGAPTKQTNFTFVAPCFLTISIAATLEPPVASIGSTTIVIASFSVFNYGQGWYNYGYKGR